MTERDLEDFTAGQTFTSGRLRVDRERITAFAAGFDPQPFHLDDAAARVEGIDAMTSAIAEWPGWLQAAGWGALAASGLLIAAASGGRIGESQRVRIGGEACGRVTSTGRCAWRQRARRVRRGRFKQSGRGRLRGYAGLDDFLECGHIAFRPGATRHRARETR